jgi:hypothetical protein
MFIATRLPKKNAGAKLLWQFRSRKVWGELTRYKHSVSTELLIGLFGCLVLRLTLCFQKLPKHPIPRWNHN